MPGSSNTSFIPKRNPAHNEKQNVKRQVFLGSFLIRILFISSLLAALGVFLYESKLNKDLDTQIVKLNDTISTFDEEKMQRVLAIDKRLRQANTRLNSSASMVSLLGLIEESTTGSNQITNLALNRVDDKTYDVSVEMKTNTFDAVMFQREVLEKSGVLAVSEIKDLNLQNVPPKNALFNSQASGEESVESDKVVVSFGATLTVDISKIPHTPTPADFTIAPVIPIVSVETVATSTELEVEAVPEEVNSEDI